MYKKTRKSNKQERKELISHTIKDGQPESTEETERRDSSWVSVSTFHQLIIAALLLVGRRDSR